MYEEGNSLKIMPCNSDTKIRVKGGRVTSHRHQSPPAKGMGFHCLGFLLRNYPRAAGGLRYAHYKEEDSEYQRVR